MGFYNPFIFSIRDYFWLGLPHYPFWVAQLSSPKKHPIPWRIHGAAIYGAPWIPSIYPSHVSIYTSTMDPMGNTWISCLLFPKYIMCLFVILISGLWTLRIYQDGHHLSRNIQLVSCSQSHAATLGLAAHDDAAGIANSLDLAALGLAEQQVAHFRHGQCM